ncbi:hypothetical protein [Candidatus Hodarchaeum mangrovi]
MTSLFDYIISYFIYFLPSLILAFLAVLIGLVVFYLGKRKNIQLMDNSINLLQRDKENNGWKFKLAEKTTSGRTYLVDLKKDLLLEDFRIHFTLIPRHLIISRIGSLIRKRRDYLLIEADPADKIVFRYQIEIMPYREEKRRKALFDMLGKLQKISIGNPQFEKSLGIWVNDPEFFSAVFQEKPQILRNLFSYRDIIVRFSLYPLEHPSIRLVAELSEGIEFTKLIETLFDLTAGIVNIGSKGFYAKKKDQLRIIRDKKLEEEKQRHGDRKFKI